VDGATLIATFFEFSEPTCNHVKIINMGAKLSQLRSGKNRGLFVCFLGEAGIVARFLKALA
jgi:hypothetical protein